MITVVIADDQPLVTFDVDDVVYEAPQNLYVTENTVKAPSLVSFSNSGLRDRVQAVMWAHQHHIA